MPEDLDLHIIMDNLITHKTKATRDWFARHSRWHVHYTPTSASWINQIERFFAVLTEKQLCRDVHRSTQGIAAAILDYIDTVNADPKPCRWTKAADDILAAINRFCLSPSSPDWVAISHQRTFGDRQEKIKSNFGAK